MRKTSTPPLQMTRAPAQTPPSAQAPTIPRRLIGLLLAIALTGGIVTGAILGPASAGPLTGSSPIVQRALALLAAQTLSASPVGAAAPTPPAAQSGPISEPVPVHVDEPAAHARRSPSAIPSSSSSEELASSPSSEAPPKSSSESKNAASKPIRLPPIQHVWLIVLGGSTLASATAAPTDYPYLVGQLVKQGTLLGSYTALDAYELAGDAALLPGGVGASLTLLSEPGCGTPPSSPSAPTDAGVSTTQGVSCTAGVPPAPVAADAFLQRVAGPILASSSYREDGLIVITFGLASNGAEGPATTVGLQPPAGVLLLSPLLHGARQSPTTFNALAPRQSLETIFKH